MLSNPRATCLVMDGAHGKLQLEVDPFLEELLPTFPNLLIQATYARMMASLCFNSEYSQGVHR